MPDTAMYELDNVYDKDVPPIRVLGFQSESGQGLGIVIEGHGDAVSANGYGYPILLENRDGKLFLVVWADINSDDPTHIISLAGARESEREEANQNAR